MHARIMVAMLLASAGQAWALVSFKSGSITGAGFPEPLVLAPGTVTTNGGSGGGQTGGGLVGSATIQAQNTAGANGAFSVSITGTATHGNDQFGFTGAYTDTEIVLNLTQPMNFTVSNTSTIGVTSINPIVFRSISGSIGGSVTSSGTLAAGDYGIKAVVVAGNQTDFGFFVSGFPGFTGLASGYYASAATNWTMSLTPQSTPCYANCDGNTSPPLLTAGDFVCFLGKFRAGNAYANCDGSTSAPVLGAADFVCYLNKFRAGCP
jgi:hypothetical protein